MVSLSLSWKAHPLKVALKAPITKELFVVIQQFAPNIY